MAKLTRIPAICDVHVHLRDPGAIHKEDFYSGSCAALAGGVVAMIDMPNNSAPTTSLSALRHKKELASQKCVCDYGFYFGADNNNWEAAKTASDKVFGLKIYMDHTTGPLLVEDLQILESFFKGWVDHKPILVHAEDTTLGAAIGLALSYKKWLHVCHVSQECELDLIKKARERGGRVTCEVTPHHLFLTQKSLKSLGTFAKMRPPLRRKSDQDSLWKALKSGFIDYIATDHAPHTIKEKKSGNAPNGVPGLETLLPLMLTAVSEGKLSLQRLIELVSVNPAKLLGFKLQDSWTEVDLGKRWIINRRKLKTKCGWSPFEGWEVKGKIIRVVIRGKTVFEDGQILVQAGFGRHL